MSPLCTLRWGHAGLPLSALSVTVCESHSFLFSAFFGAGGQTRDVDPMLG